MFSKVLIANRGEIAVRVIRACQEMGIATVAVYSDLDHSALHVRLADEAYAIGGTTAAESYLKTEAIIAAINRSGADAVHPGYGFQSENADFARTVTDLGVTFIGPPPAAIEVMGDKISARGAATAVGVLGVPGTSDFIVDSAEVERFAESHGWPIAVKAAYGGGGRGMKVVTSASEVAEAVESARREAKAYFGRDELYMERYLQRPRHVEVQVLADAHGNCVHLGTRDCSSQRRHQKLVEEAPAPQIPSEVLAAMGEAAVRVARGCGYVNAGTVEFLYSDGEFYYLEMNTRLQVEHPVTEAVTGIDLVEQQLRVAAGEPLRFTQDDIQLQGHAIEVRVNAEDPAGGAFLPSPGRIQRLRPADGFGTRWDGGYEAGDEVSQYYDNLIGKLVVWGRDRPTAIARTQRALKETIVTGVATTISAAQAIIGHPDFAAVTHSTKWVENQLDLSDVALSALSSVAGTQTSFLADNAEADGLDDEDRVRREVDVEVDGKRFSVAMWVRATSGSGADAPGGAGSSGASRAALRRKTSRHLGTSGGPGEVTVPMQGTIVKVLVKPGDSVESGDVVVVLEAMKMENNINAGRSGTVSEVRVNVGDSVGGGDIVAVID